jgi:hypothetical protein
VASISMINSRRNLDYGPPLSGALSSRGHLYGKRSKQPGSRALTLLTGCFSVALTRITSVPECAVSSVEFLWGPPTVPRTCGVSVGPQKPLTQPRPTDPVAQLPETDEARTPSRTRPCPLDDSAPASNGTARAHAGTPLVHPGGPSRHPTVPPTLRAGSGPAGPLPAGPRRSGRHGDNGHLSTAGPDPDVPPTARGDHDHSIVPGCDAQTDHDYRVANCR